MNLKNWDMTSFRAMNKHCDPVCIDLFAGPGGLGEGFAARGFSIAVSIEKEAVECETLFRRKLYRKLVASGQAKYAKQVVDNNLSKQDIHAQFPKMAEAADFEVAQLELGSVPFREVYERINSALLGSSSHPKILLGGPPCQAYSIVGRSRNIGKSKVSENPQLLHEFYEDARHTLYREYLKVLSAFGPEVFIMENVKGILSAKTGQGAEKGSVINNIISDLLNPSGALELDIEFQTELEDLGVRATSSNYVLVPLVESAEDDLLKGTNETPRPSDFLIRCEEHGIPQTRHRVIICGIRDDVFRALGKPRQLSKNKSAVTLRQVIGSLPNLRSNITRQNVSEHDWSYKVSKEIERLASIKNPRVQKNAPVESVPRKASVIGNKDLSDFLEDTAEYITAHKTRSHMISDLARYYFCADFAERMGRSPKIQDWPVGRLAPEHKDIRNEGNRLSSSGFSDRFKVQLWQKPASTITSHISKDGHYFIHPDKTQCRSFSVREAARIQTFPDSYHFCGGISKQFHQIGNAVPPYLAFQIAQLLGEYLQG
jgi:DNA (cytosine-5)-methyltransferase 1